tara:strand:- start:488 stop:592 length:105 start_codon:yes stop_codon:yes gene_type:complete
MDESLLDDFGNYSRRSRGEQVSIYEIATAVFMVA